MITQDDNLKYDKTRHEYYITTDGVLENTIYNDGELVGIFGENLDKVFKQLSKRVYRYIYQHNLNRKVIHYKIYLNADNERQDILDAIIEYVNGAVLSGMDLNQYLSNGKSDLPSGVYEILSKGLLYFGDMDEKYIDTSYTDGDY